ncbi:protein transport protein Sec16B isoform X3 [Sitophilus oryzae]|uniref:Protein transport protein sec16 n=1 Tax=Sitophilus oryzae TaxID=7048 RepID=A0A6J2XDN0_SITOR|nr:protein transport protein Sec16B isoform X3 [Sitophilus oryzae]
MSWAQRRGPPRPSPSSNNTPIQMFNPQQHSTVENQWQPPPVFQQQQDHAQAQNYWQQPQQVYPPPSRTPNANTGVQYQQFQQEPSGGYFKNQSYNQQYDQSGAYSNQPVQPATEADGWGENWAWGEEDNSNAQTMAASQQHQQLQSTANVLADSFSNDESWNWSVSEIRTPENNAHQQDQKPNDLFPTVGDLKKPPVSNTRPEAPPQSNRSKLETPQWSTESQPSIESSDDVAHTSESDKSHLVSRSSTISHSPVSGQEQLGAVGVEVPPVENNEIIRQENNKVVNNVLPPPKNVLTPPLMPSTQGGPDDSRNPYKRSSGNRYRAPTTQPPPQTSFTPQSVNLETLPDNSEHPDYPPVSGVSKVPQRAPLQWPQAENNEAPINDRNQYLETGQLSDLGLSEGNEVNDLGNDTLPPPGLQRMVPGQLEQSEPLLGFSRMVLGENNINQAQYDLSGPPEGLRRMVPGESSSPEVSIDQQNIDDNDSDGELNRITQNSSVQPQRSATIGADTPPRVQNPVPQIQQAPVNRAELIGHQDLAQSSSIDILDAIPLSKSSSNDNKSKHSSKAKDKDLQENRREIIDGQINESSVTNLTNSIRNLTVGENLTDGQTSNTSVHEHSPRRHSRQESSESDSDRKHPSRSSREKRSMEKSKSRDKERDRYKEKDSDRERYNKDRDDDRYSPDSYRDKRDRRDRRYRERRYEEDTDYYSDKEKDRRMRDNRDRDYERKYSSLRKDKDRRRKERDGRDYRDSRRYYGRYGEEYGVENRSSRPSSRSDSMHESYRERRHDPEPRDRDRRPRDRDRERDRHRNRDHRESYNPYQGYAYDPYNPYYQQYQYYENLRRTNPQAYAEWYRKYYQQTVGSNASFTAEDRGSVHSGRSSANDELAKDRYTRQSFYSQSSAANYYGQSRSLSGQYVLDSSSYNNRTFDQTDTTLAYDQQPGASQRLTPAKFATVHLKASIASGRLVRVLPNYPMDDQSATVEIRNLESLLENDPEYLELRSFPGPLVKGVTHKKQVIEYCDKKIKSAAYNRGIADVDSYVLMWELLILLIRQNGMVVGTDIAELLLKNQNTQVPPRSSSVLSTASSTGVGERNENTEILHQAALENGSTNSVAPTSTREDEVTKKFREYLLYGSCKEALEWAMKHELWGHALFLASKLDKRTYANVMMRFANGLTLNDPLQTLYQLLSGKVPAAVTCVSDEKWGDWRPHLAMILSNSSLRPDLNCRAITQLGDTLLNRGCLYAAQFCYLMSEVGFGKHDDASTRLVLLGSDHRRPFPQFVINEAVHMTEIYEFACSLNDQGFYIKEFQIYKYLLATRLADAGLLEKSLLYLERLASHIIAQPTGVSPVLIDGVCALSDKLKFHDPLGDPDEDESAFGSDLETSRPDNSWLKDLKAIQNDFQTGNIVQDTYVKQEPQVDVPLQQTYANAPEPWQLQQQYQYEQQVPQMWQPEPQIQVQPEENIPQQHEIMTNQYQDPQQQNYWPGQQEQPLQYIQDQVLDQQQHFDQPPGYYESLNNQAEMAPPVQQQPQISMPNQASAKSGIFDDEPLPHETQAQNRSPAKTQQQKPSAGDESGKQQSTGWFGGIFSKLSMKPKNQMKLPDDKNPKIVWDQDKKRWTNVDGDSNDAAEFKPPPKMADLMPKPSQAPPGIGFGSLQSSSLDYASANFNGINVASNDTPFYIDQGPASLPVASPTGAPGEDSGVPPKAAQPNMFKMNRGRNLKNSYVNVFKQNGVMSSGGGPQSLPGPESIPAAPAQMNLFIPQAVNDPNAPVDFLTPGGAPIQIGESQMSRWSSSSSLSREVASYMLKKNVHR